MPISRSAGIRPAIFAVVGVILAVLACLEWLPRARHAWGLGPKHIQERAMPVAHALGSQVQSAPHQRIILSPTGPIWVSRWTSHLEQATVVQNPTGNLLGSQKSPWAPGLHLEPDQVSAWGEEIEASLSKALGDATVERTESDSGDETIVLIPPVGPSLSMHLPRTGCLPAITLLSADIPRIPESSPSLFPLVLMAILSFALLSLAMRSIWKTIEDALPNPGHAGWWATSAGVAAVLAMVDHLSQGCPATISILVTIVFGAIVAGLVLVGYYLWNSRAPQDRDALPPGSELKTGWLLGISGIGFASVALLLPGVAETSMSRFVGPGFPWLQSLFLAFGVGLASELGIRPILDRLFHRASTLVALLLSALIIAAWVPFSLSSAWWWDRIVFFFATVLSGLVAKREGPVAATLALSLFFLAFFGLPGIGTSGFQTVLSILILAVGFVAIPVLGLRFADNILPHRDAGPPAHIQRMHRAVEEAYSRNLLEELQEPLCKIDLTEKEKIQVGMVLRRAEPPAADVCCVMSLSKNRLGVFLADVPGDGFQALIRALEMRITTQTVAPTKQSPAAVLAELDRVILSSDHSGDGAYMLSYGIIDQRSNSLTLSLAGNEPVLLHRALAGKFEHLGSRCEGITASRESGKKRQFDTVTAQLVSRDLIIFFSNGLVRGSSEDDEGFGTARLQDIVRNHPNASCHELADIFLAELDAFLDGVPPADDIVVLFIRNG